MRIKLDVEEVTQGMFVAELDRPWLESPFLFQGFVIESDEDLNTLKETCNYVFIDDQKSRDTEELQRLFESLTKTEKKAPPPGMNENGGAATSFKNSIEKTAETVNRSRSSVIRFFDDARLGKSIDTEDAKAVVGELVSEITYSPNTALWLTSLRTRHEETANHCLNVSILAVAFGKHLGYSHDKLQELGLGALMHDVGVARIPKEILDKPGKLSQEEFEMMKKHPRAGHGVLKVTKSLPEMSLDIILHHHERLDGSGYPDGLKAEEISEAVRIVAICDTYDAMTSNRTYSKALPPQDVLTRMHKRSESQYGRALMEEFIKCVGIYPIGSLVVLNTGALGMVMSSNAEAKLKPLVLLIRDENGRDVRPRKLVNLAQLAQQRGDKAWSISRTVNPDDYGIDLSAVASEEMRIA
ncbi:MAG: HD-GYP domain-containing protein [Gammaproteobacteria bacterium]|nr:HD-GYP domain-containing protein [Gammaproteobacteria bacterium]